MATERRIRADFENYELRNARVFKARKDYPFCVLCWGKIYAGHLYARVSETRLEVCKAHFTESDIVSLTPRDV
jgi:hypothetical protein